MIDTALDSILFIFFAALLVNTIYLRTRIRTAKEQAGSGSGEDNEPRMTPKEAWRHSLFIASFHGFLIVYAGYKTFAGTWSWPLGTVAILVSVWLIRRPLLRVKQSKPIPVRFSKDLHLAFPSAESGYPPRLPVCGACYAGIHSYSPRQRQCS
jgi:hypothetical protein